MELESTVKKRLTEDIHTEKIKRRKPSNENEIEAENDKLKIKFEEIDLKDIDLEKLQQRLDKLMKQLDAKKGEVEFKKKSHPKNDSTDVKKND
ncbi:hypothetical protein [Lysinibacillus fusiformis]|uniref:hypothetical protein n=1 Tax=Lysinibacillus fusiformis TaxID=28031 RepID=UPI001EF52E86|nr:hypothetical protein [Lysinibacillus fusiformis]MCG7435549.1 hypothetical protein [Lysinibacillus fusiformis]